MKKTLLTAMLAATLLHSATIDVRDADITGTSNITWTTGNTYILKEKIFVEAGGVLRIQPGVIVKAETGTGQDAKALIICKGARIYAEGTKEQPIIMTSVSEDLNNYNFLDINDRGLWGGVVILGKAKVSRIGGVSQIEGISETDTRGEYGGTDDNDTSGIFRYVSIRYPGTVLGPDNELNGLTMGGVGRGTVIEYVEVTNSNDDGFEWFGGTVNCRYLVSIFNDDDAFDYDAGWMGRGQYWFCIQREVGDACGEHDGGEVGLPSSKPVIANATYIGGSSNAGYMINFRVATGGKYINSIFSKNQSFNIEESGNPSSLTRLQNGDLLLSGCVFYANGSSFIYYFTSTPSRNLITATSNKNCIQDPGFVLTSRIPDGNNLDVRPKGTNCVNNTTYPCYYPVTKLDSTGFIKQEWFKGAFDPTKNSDSLWTGGWTTLSKWKIFKANQPKNFDSLLVPSDYISTEKFTTTYSKPICQARFSGSQLQLKWSGNTTNGLMRITDIKGVVLYNKTVNLSSNISPIGISQLSQGSYLVSIKSGNTWYHSRAVKVN